MYWYPYKQIRKKLYIIEKDGHLLCTASDISWIVSYGLFAFPSQNSTHMYSPKAAPPWQATAMSAVCLD